MPYLSVVVPTMRAGGLDVLLGSLGRQVYDDFELVISDGLYRWRAEAVAELAKSYKFPIKHVEPVGNPFPVIGFCRYSNTALIHADGEVVVFISDYTWLPPDCLATHAKFHKENMIKSGLMCPHKYTALPELNPEFSPYKHKEIDKYTYEIHEGKLENCKVSIFKEFFSGNPAEMATDPIMGNCDPKLKEPAGEIGFEFLHAKNESCRLEEAIAINGWDEDLDGTNCYQDSDFSDRLHLKAGVKWICNPENVVYIINPRNIFPKPVWHRPIDSNYRIWQYKKDHGYPAINTWNLSEARKQLRGL